MRRTLAALLAALPLLSAACRFDQGHFTMLSDFPVQAVDLPEDEIDRLPYVEASDIVPFIVVLPIGERPSVERALQNALLGTNGDVLVDVTVEKEWFWIPFVYGWQGYHIRGKPVKVLHAPDRPRTRRSRLLQEHR